MWPCARLVISRTSSAACRRRGWPAKSYEYLVEAMRGYAEGERTNNADMMRIMEAMSPDEREAMARYISGL